MSIVSTNSQQISDYDIACTAEMVLGFSKKKKIVEGRLVINSFLQNATDRQQINFWNHFKPANLEFVERLFDVPFPDVTKLCFANQMPIPVLTDPTDATHIDDFNSWEFFLAKAVEKCPNITKIEIATEGKGEIPRSIVNAIIGCKRLESVKMPNFYLTNPAALLDQLSQELPLLKKLDLHMHYSSALTALSPKVTALFTGLSLRFGVNKHYAAPQPDRKEKRVFYDDAAVKKVEVFEFIKKCIKLKRLCANCSVLFNAIPATVSSLEVVLPPDKIIGITLARLASKIKELPSLKNLSFIQVSISSTRLLNEVQDIVESVSNLTSLSAPQLTTNQEEEGVGCMHALYKKKSLKEVSFQLRHDADDLKELRLLSTRKRKVIEVTVPMKSVGFEELLQDVNERSKVSCLVVKAIVPLIGNPCDSIAPFLCAVNPHTLVFSGFFNDEMKPIKKTKISLAKGASKQLLIAPKALGFPLNKLTRLKKIVFSGEQFWKFSKKLDKIMYTTTTFDSYGRPVLAKVIDLDRLTAQ